MNPKPLLALNHFTVPVDEEGGAEPARACGEVAEGRFPLPVGGGGRLVKGAVAGKDENLNRSGHCEGDAL